MISPREQTSTGKVVVATFTDPNGAQNVGSYTATINWGDGSPVDTQTTITFSHGTFSVSGTHTYETPGDFSTTITITRSLAQAAIFTGTANVASIPIKARGRVVRGTETVPLTDAVVALFTTKRADAAVGDYTATIDWGDGQTTDGTITEVKTGKFEVTGDHTYIENASRGNNVVKVTITRVASGNQTFVFSHARIKDLPIGSPAGLTLTEPASTELTDLLLGTFVDPNADNTSADQYTAIISWGDRSRSTAKSDAPPIIQLSDTAGVWQVLGSHTYAKAKTYTVRIIVRDIASRRSVVIKTKITTTLG
jgi:hypothetical protein